MLSDDEKRYHYLKYQKFYYANHKEKIKEYYKLYYQKNKNKIVMDSENLLENSKGVK